MEKWYPIIWLVLAVVLGGAELLSVQLVSIWFALGAAVTVLVSLTGVPFPVQLAAFVLVSCLALIFSRPLARRILNKERTPTNADAVIGMVAIVTEKIDNLHEVGRVQVNGLSWSARAENGVVLASGDEVLVCRIDGVKLIVTPLNTSAAEPESGERPNK